MSGTACNDITTFGSLDALPPDALTLLAGAPTLFDHTAWWRVILSDALPPGASPVFVVIRVNGSIAALIPMLRNGRRLDALTTPYSCTYVPLLVPGADWVAAMTTFGRFCRTRGVTRLDAIPVEWPGLVALLSGISRASLKVLRFDHFGNWSEDVAGLDWAAYLKRRQGALRETIRRRMRRAENLEAARFHLFTRPADMDIATAAFESVYRRSWKDPEPFPTFNTALMRSMATAGTLRFGLWSIGADAVAVQLWVVHGNEAIVLKLAHDEAFTAHSPGTVLTALMLRHLLDQEHVGRIDFGRGDDDYKQGWVSERRQRIGLLLVNPWRPAGALALARHAVGRIRARTRGRPGISSR